MIIRGRILLNDKEKIFFTENNCIYKIPEFDLEFLVAGNNKKLSSFSGYQAIATVKNINNDYIDLGSLEIKMWKHP